MTDTNALAPTDTEIDAIADQHKASGHGTVWPHAFARAVLAKWGAPAPAQPVAQWAPVSERLPEPGEAAVQALIDSAPAPFRRLGELLASTLDEDQWEYAQSLLLGGLVAVQEGRDIQGDIDHYNENMG